MSYAKGRKAELEYAEKLRNQGWKTEIAPKGNRFTKQKDFFGHWDIVSIHPTLNLWRLTQVKSGTSALHIAKHEEAAKEIPIGTIVEIAHRRKNKSEEERWRIIKLRN